MEFWMWVVGVLILFLVIGFISDMRAKRKSYVKDDSLHNQTKQQQFDKDQIR
ncbi:hypothetical protein GLW08_03890 [Pontibacillus yanchengensis]|uniref:Uncharacterized protein n=2 Tax=Pontibacillus yanchengensis TaxID=462910 RepID=A0ACC7VC02_9BACI|nr:hypothetical protein [Pontibacillus yanchengensis]MYL35155.1 hypothetical protein [Pontibacillus yanchengensis]MYL52478.1 hypothetical protein [Pontibacillus yanchengensis]